MLRRFSLVLLLFTLLPLRLFGQGQSTAKPKPRVVIISVNRMGLDIIRPLILQDRMPNLASVIKKGAYGKLRTVSAPNCPRVFSTLFTSTKPEEHGVMGFVVEGITANTHKLNEEPIWSVLSKHGVSVGMANVPATFPAMPVNGYMISGMLTRGKNCEDGLLCAPKLSEVEGGDAVYPPAMKAELLKNVGDFYIDCERMPSVSDLNGHEAEVIDAWLNKVQAIRDQQTRLFDYLLNHHPTEFTWLGQSCEDRTGRWLYPSAPYNAGHNSKVKTVRTEAFPNQCVAFDKVLGAILKHVDDKTYVIIISDQGIKPPREFEETDSHAHMDHEKTTPAVAKHDFADGDVVPGSFFAMGPGIKPDLHLMGLEASVYDIAPTILHIYGIEKPAQMRGHVLNEIFEGSDTKAAQK